MERLCLVIVVVAWATAESMPPTPLQKTINGLFQPAGARPHMLEDLDVDDSENDYQFGNQDGNYGLDDSESDDRDSLLAGRDNSYGEDDADMKPSSRGFSDSYPTRLPSLLRRRDAQAANRGLDIDEDNDDDGVGYDNGGLDLDDDDDVEFGYQEFKPKRADHRRIEASSRVRADIARIHSRLPTMHLSDEQGVIDNMDAIVRDAEELSSDAISPSRRKSLKKATELRMSSLRTQLGFHEGERSVTDFHSPDTPLRKVNRDISQLEEKLESLNLPASVKSETMDNLRKIETNAKELSNPMTSRNRKEKLKEATNLRMKALKKEMERGQSPSNWGDHRDPKMDKIDRDVGVLENKVKNMGMATDLRDETLSNLAAISKDAHRISHAHGTSRKRLEDAIELRTKALKEELNGPQSSHVALGRPSIAKKTRSDSLVSKVDDDLSDVLQKMGSVKMPASLVRETRDNIAAIKRDTHKIVNTHGEAHKKLEEAIKLRTRALKQELDIEKSSTSPSKALKIAKVDSDITALEEKVSDFHASKKLKTELTSNLAAIKKDSHMLASSEGDAPKQKRMMKAIGLRTKALKGELKAMVADK